MISCPFVCRTTGDAPDSRGFKWVLADPLKPETPWGTAWVPAGGSAYASASKGRFTAGGKNYHWLLDPRTGMPAEKCTAAIVQSTDAATAQALAYAAFVLGGTEGMDNAGKTAIGGLAVVTGQGRYDVAKSGSLDGHLEVK
jgi:thiamine biosynthesis lipoprotein ApbE